MTPRKRTGPRRITVLGSTGSIGVNTLEVVRFHGDRLQIGALAARSNWRRLADQALAFRPRLVALYDDQEADRLREALRGEDIAVRCGMEGLLEAAVEPSTDTVVSALVGSVGLRPVLEAINVRKTICLANKETLVVGGRLVTEAARSKGVEIIPVDSEHSAIFQCLGDCDRRSVKRLILTASGGPFRTFDPNRLRSVTPEEALRHPNWDMGGKITIDSATLMNKGLEVIEAHWLFGIPFEQVEVVVHPQSIVHSLVEFVDGSVLAQMGTPDMKLPIQYALSHPERWPQSSQPLDLLSLGGLTFEPPRWKDFPCLGFGYEAGRRGGTLPCVMNAANEIAVDAFLRGKLHFTAIAEVIRQVMEQAGFLSEPGLSDLLSHDQVARQLARQIIGNLGSRAVSA